MMFSNEQLAIAALIAGALAYVVMRKGARAVNPASRDNVAYKGANAIGDILNDGEADNDFLLGTSLYNWLNDDSARVDNGRVVPSTSRQTGSRRSYDPLGLTDL